MANQLPDKTTIDPKLLPNILDGLATGGVVLPIADTGGNLPPVVLSGGLSGALAEWTLVLVGIILVALVYENDPRAGSLLLLIITLLMLLGAQKRGLL